MKSRHLDWVESYNIRDLGGLRAAGGASTRRGALVRAESPSRLSESGWAALREHGVRTIIDLTGIEESRPDAAARPPEVTTLRLPLEDRADAEFWSRWGRQLTCTPLYYDAFLDRFPGTIAEVVTAIAHAQEGGVLVHCGAGRDRTGLIVLVLLAFAGVPPEEIIEDHSLSHERLRPLHARSGRLDEEAVIERVLAERGTTAAEVLRGVLGRDFVDYLRAAGVEDSALSALRRRLVDRC